LNKNTDRVILINVRNRIETLEFYGKVLKISSQSFVILLPLIRKEKKALLMVLILLILFSGNEFGKEGMLMTGKYIFLVDTLTKINSN